MSYVCYSGKGTVHQGGRTRNGDLTDSRGVLEGLITCQMVHLLWHSPLPQVRRYKSLTIRIMRSRLASANFWDVEGLQKKPHKTLLSVMSPTALIEGTCGMQTGKSVFQPGGCCSGGCSCTDNTCKPSHVRGDEDPPAFILNIRARDEENVVHPPVHSKCIYPSLRLRLRPLSDTCLPVF